MTLSGREPVVASDNIQALDCLLVVEYSASPIIFRSIAESLRKAQASSVTVALPGRRWPGRQPARRRWSELCSSLSLKRVEPGSKGWARFDLGALGSRLDALLLPAELLEAERVVILPGRNQSGPFDCWRQIVHPYTRMHADLSRHRASLTAELAAAIPAEYAFRLDLANEQVTIWTDDVVAARLIWLCALAFRSVDDEIERRTPWEDAQVQAAAELGIGVQTGTQLQLLVYTASATASSFVEFTERTLACQVNVADEIGRGS